MIEAARADALRELQRDLPSKIMDWSAEGPDRIFDSNTLFEYIDGGAEVYRAYNLRQCLSRRYVTADGPAIILDVFDMGTSKDAFGVFTHDMNGAVVRLGQDARFQPGWLSFWKGRFFVSIYTEEETHESRNAVMALGNGVASLIKQRGSRPAILSKLPTRGLCSDTVRYLHHPVVLNYHYYLADKNLLGISNDTDVVLADYREDGEVARLLLIAYPDVKTAHEALERFLKYYLPDVDHNGFAPLENGKWAGYRTYKALAAVVLEADSRGFADQVLNRVFEKK